MKSILIFTFIIYTSFYDIVFGKELCPHEIEINAYPVTSRVLSGCMVDTFTKCVTYVADTLIKTQSHFYHAEEMCRLTNGSLLELRTEEEHKCFEKSLIPDRDVYLGLVEVSNSLCQKKNNFCEYPLTHNFQWSSEIQTSNHCSQTKGSSKTCCGDTGDKKMGRFECNDRSCCPFNNFVCELPSIESKDPVLHYQNFVGDANLQAFRRNVVKVLTTPGNNTNFGKWKSVDIASGAFVACQFDKLSTPSSPPMESTTPIIKLPTSLPSLSTISDETTSSKPPRTRLITSTAANDVIIGTTKQSDSAAWSNFRMKEKIMISVVIPVIALLSVAILLIYFLNKRRKLRAQLKPMRFSQLQEDLYSQPM